MAGAGGVGEVLAGMLAHPGDPRVLLVCCEALAVMAVRDVRTKDEMAKGGAIVGAVQALREHVGDTARCCVFHDVFVRVYSV